jgi:hypothetical protein
VATTDQLAMLRAMVEGDFDRHTQLSNQLHASGGLDGYGTVIGAASFIAISMQFEGKGGYRPEDVIKLVAETRTMLDLNGDVIDPRTAELVVRSALGEGGLLAGIPATKVVEAQMAISSYLAAERKLGDPDAFMREVEELLADWATKG